MKYGERLAEESAQQWRLREFNPWPSKSMENPLSCRSCLKVDSCQFVLIHIIADNMDYNSLKTLIKVNTAGEGVTEIATPSCLEETARKFEKRFFAELCQNYDTASLFVSSKAGEIDRRLSTSFLHFSNYISTLLHPHMATVRCQRRSAQGLVFSMNPLTRTNFASDSLSNRVDDLITHHPSSKGKFFSAKIACVSAQCHSEQRQCDYDIRSLQRFINAQLVAFQKIMKKYKRWTGSSALDSPFRNFVRSHPRDLTRYDVWRLQSRCNDILAELRAEFSSADLIDSLASSSIDAPVIPRVSRSTRPSLLPGSSGYWNEYIHPGDVDGWFQNRNGCHLMQIEPDEVAALLGDCSITSSLVSATKNITYYQKVKATCGSRESDSDGDFTPSGCLSFSAYGTADASGQSNKHDRIMWSNNNMHQGESSTGHGANSPESASVFELSSIEDGKSLLLWRIWFCLGVSFLSMGIMAPLILTKDYTRSLDGTVGVVGGAMVSLGAASAALCMMFSYQSLFGRTAKLAVWMGFMISCALNGALLIFLLEIPR